MPRDTDETIKHTAGGSFHPHISNGDAPYLRDYACRACWQTMESHTEHALVIQVCGLGPNEAIVHRNCCPVCIKR